jgi:hypothetical protein
MYKIWLQITLVLAFAAFTAMTNEARSKDDDQLNTRAARFIQRRRINRGNFRTFLFYLLQQHVCFKQYRRERNTSSDSLFKPLQ